MPESNSPNDSGIFICFNNLENKLLLWKYVALRHQYLDYLFHT
jgi:hypothetical protein